MTRTEIINHLIKLFDFKTYLEIGVWEFTNFNSIEIENKIWVDPNPLDENLKPLEISESFKMTSDEFFENSRNYYDIIFIDGLHYSAQVKKDLNNSIKFLNEGGLIVVHDCNPDSEEIAKDEQLTSEWCGTVWKGFTEWCIDNFDKYNYLTVNSDYGVGIIYKRKSKIESQFKKGYKVTWQYFTENRIDILNLIPVNIFLKLKKSDYE